MIKAIIWEVFQCSVILKTLHLSLIHTCKMKRYHLFEFEDFQWFPSWIRDMLTRYIVTIHKLLKSPNQIADLIAPILKRTGKNSIVDLCTGGGGPMPEVIEILEEKHGFSNLKITLTDLYPNQVTIAEIKKQNTPNINYLESSVDAANIPENLNGLRTMICSMHHMKPETARAILKNASDSKQPFFMYEISDNVIPSWLWWFAIPLNFVTTLIVTLFVRPITWQQILFTYIIPILPFFIAWDGAVSYVRTYTHGDLDLLLKEIRTDDYIWEKGKVQGRGGAKVYLFGLPA